MDDNPRSRTRWTDSLFVRAGALLAAIATLAVISIAIAAAYADYSAGRGTAINVAGSLRMQTWRIAMLLEDPATEAATVRAAIGEFDRRLESDRLVQSVPSSQRHPAAAELQEIRRQWQSDLRPALLEALDSGERRIGVERVDAFVAGVDRLVSQLEVVLETSINELRLIQGAALFVMLMLIVMAMYFIQSRFIAPLADLVKASRQLRAHQFDARVEYEGRDELGELSSAFNRMVEEMSALTEDLGRRVQAKTAELERTNRTVETLYSVTRLLSEQPPNEATLKRILGIVAEALGATASLVCHRPAAEHDGLVIVREIRRLQPGSHDLADADLICGFRSCDECTAHDSIEAVPRNPTDQQIVTVPLRDAGRTLGVLPIAIHRERQLEHWEVRLLDTLGQHIGAAMCNAERIDTDRSFSLYEERAAIARELHDSLAQSLSYLKIQVSRFEKTMAPDGDPADRRERQLAILEELRIGLNSAYRELRELLTTFRLRVDEAGFAASLAHAVSEFRRRTGLEARLDNRLGNVELSAHEQVHVLQIVREALANVEHHAHARHAWVELSSDGGRRVRVAVADDGVGIGATPPDRQHHHYGTTIMRDRAATLGGRLDLEARDGGGTVVALQFVSQTPYATRPERAVPPPSPVRPEVLHADVDFDPDR
jgi:two-component system, NarL family, nitrate/nitrite sensor histidine kinase NarX